MPRTASRAQSFGPLFTDTVLDDSREETDILTGSYARARHHVNDRYRGDVARIHAHLTEHPAF